MIETMAKIMMMFGAIIVIGLWLVLINDGLEYLWKHYKWEHYKTISKTQKVSRLIAPALQSSYKNFSQADYSQKIVRLDFNQINRSRENGNQLGEHVTVLPKAA